MSSSPSTKDVYIAERLAKLRDDNNDDDYNGDFPLLPPHPLPSTQPSFFSPRGRTKSDYDDDDYNGKDLTPINHNKKELQLQLMKAVL